MKKRTKHVFWCKSTTLGCVLDEILKVVVECTIWILVIQIYKESDSSTSNVCEQRRKDHHSSNVYSKFSWKRNNRSKQN